MNQIKFLKVHHPGSNFFLTEILDTVVLDKSEVVNAYRNSTASPPDKAEFPQGLDHHPDELVSLNWNFYPLKITDVSITGNLKFLSVVHLSNCLNLRQVPHFPDSLEYLLVDNTAIEGIPSSIKSLSKLKLLSICRCTRLRKLPDDILQLASLQDLDITGHYINASKFWRHLFCLSSLHKLTLTENNFEKIPESIKQLSKLEELNLNLSERLQSLPQLPPSLQALKADFCTSLQSISNEIRSIAVIDDSRSFPCQDKEEFTFINFLKLDENAHTQVSMLARSRILRLSRKALDKRFDKEKAFTLFFRERKS